MAEAVRVRTPSPLVELTILPRRCHGVYGLGRVTPAGVDRGPTGAPFACLASRSKRRASRSSGDRNRLEPRDHLLGDVEVPVGRDDDARLRADVEDERIAILLADLVEHLSDLIHDRPDELDLARCICWSSEPARV